MKRLAVLLIVCAVATEAAAEDAPAVTVDQVIAMYRDHAPRVTAAKAAVDVAAADLVEAHIYPNPTLSVGGLRTVQGEATSGVNQFTAGLEVPLLIGHQRARRGTAAAARVEVARRDVAATEAGVEIQIREQFQELQAAQERTATLVAAVDDVVRAREIVRGRVSAGASSPYALERVELAVATANSKVDDARAEERARAGELAAIVGKPGWNPRATTTLSDDEAAAAGATGTPGVPAAVAADHPILLLSEAQAAAAKADAVRAKADAVPTPSVGLTAFSTTGPEGLALMLGVSIPLPTSDKNQGQIARAHAEEHAAQLEEQASQAELAAQLDGAEGVLQMRRDALDRYRADMLARLPKVREMAESSYRSGQGGIVELLDAIDAITEAKLREVDLLAAVADAELAVRTAAAGR